MFDGVEYMNDGDWVESCTALVEDEKGEFHILHWADIVAARPSSEDKAEKKKRKRRKARKHQTPIPVAAE